MAQLLLFGLHTGYKISPIFLEATAGLLAVQGEAVDYVVVDSNGVADVIANDVAAGEQIPNVEFVRVVSGVTL